ncbi:SGNH/GDSL hydrolase family protein [Herminiimonas sp. CN]|uniref:SGNH/GDSL hydrolase family protein n=1 Tax=Herminiimonas sp. CN TaxID=1349818 RepID=UPI00055447CF|nr:SGNH/GDSL hydrolase family protein [Herminiimonas sp. CN]
MRQFYEYHPVVGYRFIPNLRARIPHEGGGYLIRVNEAGFRSDRPFVKQRSNGCRRVLFFGDSFTAGDAVANHQRYTDLLEARIPALEVYNFGLSSSGTDQQYLVWREFAQGIECDLVVIAVFVENVRRVAARYRPHHDEAGRERIYAKPYYTLERELLQLHHVPPRPDPLEAHELSPEESGAVDSGGRFPLLRKVVTALGAKEAMQRLSHYQPVPEYNAGDSPGWQLMRAILAQWVRSIGKPVLIMPIPLPQHIDETCDASPYQARFAELAAELGCALYDPLPDLRQCSPAQRRRLRWEKDIHFTPEGHDVLARSLAPLIEQLLAGQR